MSRCTMTRARGPEDMTQAYSGAAAAASGRAAGLARRPLLFMMRGDAPRDPGRDRPTRTIRHARDRGGARAARPDGSLLALLGGGSLRRWPALRHHLAGDRDRRRLADPPLGRRSVLQE